uniref:HTH CENPB-type domain-containing protein n=1 Tax=Callorhinchus milii TaxID=7868 RepID=A0A4W3IPE2_CALMI
YNKLYRYTTLTLAQRVEVLKKLENKESQKSIAAEFDVDQSAISRIQKNREKILDEWQNNSNPERKRHRLRKAEDVEAALLRWFSQARSQQVPVNGPLLMEKANSLATELGIEFKATNGWLERWKKKHSIQFKKKAGEYAGIDLQIVQEWKDEKLHDILQRYEAKDIYNADETGLFWQMLPEKSLGFAWRDSHHRSKQPKTQIMLLVGANMDGSDKLPLYTIGKNMWPRAFKNFHRLPLEYSANKKAWMTSVMFEGWLKKLDWRIGQENRKVAMILDKCSAHSSVELDNIELIFLPPNTTSVTQPMHGGVIRNLKFHYRHILATRRLDAAQHALPFKWDLLDAMFAMQTAWSGVSQTTISSCYKKVAFEGTADQYITDDSEQETEQQFQNIWDCLAQIYGSLIPSLDEYVDVDMDDTKDTRELSDQDIMSLVSDEADANCPSDEMEGSELGDSTPFVPTVSDAYHALDIVRRFSMTVESPADEILELADKFEAVVMSEVPKRMKQKIIAEYYQAK